MYSMVDQRLEILVQLKDEATAAFGKIKGALGDANSAIEKASGASSTLAKGLAVAGGGVVALGGMFLKSASDAEQMQTSFTVMLGSAEKAKKFMKDLADFSAKTPFNLPGVSQASKQLLAYGSTQENVLKQVGILGDIASGVGKDKLPQLILAFGQVQAATKLTGNEMRQFTEAGVPLIDALATHFGVTKDKIAQMASDGKIKFKDVEESLGSLTAKGGPFFEMMAKQSETLSGRWSTVTDNFGIFMTQQGKPLLDWAKQFVEWLNIIVIDVLPKVAAKIGELTQWFLQHKEAIIFVVSVITAALLPAVWSLVAAFAAGAVALAPWLLGGAVIGGIGAGIYYIVTHWDELAAKAKQVWDYIVGKLKEAWNWIRSTIGGGIDYINGIFNAGLTTIKDLWTTAWTGLGNVVSDIWDGIKSAVVGSINWLVDKINSFIKMVNRASAAAAGVVGLSAPQISEIPKLAKGGIVDRPTMAMIGEAGPEAVVPLNRARMGGLGLGSNITIVVNGDVSGDELIDKTAKALVKRLQLSTAIV